MFACREVFLPCVISTLTCAKALNPPSTPVCCIEPLSSWYALMTLWLGKRRVCSSKNWSLALFWWSRHPSWTRVFLECGGGLHARTETSEAEQAGRGGCVPRIGSTEASYTSQEENLTATHRRPLHVSRPLLHFLWLVYRHTRWRFKCSFWDPPNSDSCTV